MKKLYLFFAALGILAGAACSDDDPTTPPAAPEISVGVSTVIPATGGAASIDYRIVNPAEGGGTLEVTSDKEWIHYFSISPEKVEFTVDPNPAEPGSAPREATLSFVYPRAQTVKATITQAAPEVVEPTPLSFTFHISEVTPSSVQVDCTPSDPEATYVLRIIRQTDYAAYADDQALIAADIEEFRKPDWMGNPGEIAKHLITGSREDESFSLYAAGDYYTYAYGLKDDGTVTSELFKEPFTVPESPKISLSSDYPAYAPLEVPIEGGTYEIGYTIENPLDGAELTVEPAWGVEWVHDFVVSADKITFTVDSNAAAEPGGEPRTTWFNVSYPDAVSSPAVNIRQAAPTELGFDLKQISVTPSEIIVDCTPSDLKATYVLRHIEKADYDRLGSDAALIAADIEDFCKPDWMGNPGEIAKHLMTDSRKGETFSVYGAGEYYVYAYGLTPDGTATSEVEKLLVIVPESPKITLSRNYPAYAPLEVPIEGGTYEIGYTIENPLDGAELTVEPAWGVEWVHDFVVSADKITFTVDSNAAAEPGSEPRTTWFNVSYPDAVSSPAVNIRQAAPEKIE